jgi:hypothetical protein
MMNAQPLDSRRRLLALTYPTTSAQTPHACRPRPSPRIPRTGYRDQLALPAFLRGKVAFRR